MTIEQAHIQEKAIWKWLSKYSNPGISSVENQEIAARACGFDVSKYRHVCPYCEYSFRKNEKKGGVYGDYCHECPFVAKYKETCIDLGLYELWSENCTPEMAKEVYDMIKNV